MTQADIALIGLAVMGQNLVLNMADHGFTVAVYNRTTSVVDAFVKGPAKGMTIIGTHSLEELVAASEAAAAGDAAGEGRPAGGRLHREADPAAGAGRHHHRRRQLQLRGHDSPDSLSSSRKGLLYVGTGVSGGEEGARHGPSLMPGGSPAAWPHIKPIFQAVAAKVPEGIRTARPAATGWARTAPATSSRWCTTASSTATCRSSPRPISS